MASSDSKFDLVGIGVCAIDYVFSVDGFPTIDEKWPSQELSIQGGGAASNIIWAAARLGLQCSIIARIGADGNGNLLLEEFAKAGVDTSGVVKQFEGRTPITAVIVDTRTLSRTCIHDNTGLTSLDLAEVNPDVCRRTRMLVSDGWFPRASLRCAEIARDQGGLVVVSIEHVNNEVAQLCSVANVVTTSISLVKRSVDHDDLEEAVKRFASLLGIDTVVTTQGDKGCLLLSNSAVRSIPATKVKTVDTTGAGDAFTAGLCYGLLSEWPLEYACSFANLVGASACEGKGARPSTLLDVSRIPEARSSLDTKG